MTHLESRRVAQKLGRYVRLLRIEMRTTIGQERESEPVAVEVAGSILLQAHRHGVRVRELGRVGSLPPTFRLCGVVFHRTDAFEAYEAYRRALEEAERG